MTIPQKEWALTKQALNKLFLQINPDLEIAAEQYSGIYQRLIKFFECQDCNFAEDCADETVNRVIRKIDEGENIAPENLGKYFYGVARNVLREYWRKKQPESLEDLPPSLSNSLALEIPENKVEKQIQKEQQLECLEACLQKMNQPDKALIFEYYQKVGRDGIETREKIAQSIGIPISNLRVKMHRLREKLEQCVNNCLTK